MIHAILIGLAVIVVLGILGVIAFVVAIMSSDGNPFQ